MLKIGSYYGLVALLPLFYGEEINFLHPVHILRGGSRHSQHCKILLARNIPLQRVDIAMFARPLFLYKKIYKSLSGGFHQLFLLK